MAIYSKRSGAPIEIVRIAEIGDVKKYENRRPDASDRKNVKARQYYVCKWKDGSGGEFLCALWFLCADGGSHEIMLAIAGVSMSWQDVCHWIAQGAINISEGMTTIEKDSPVHRAMIAFCEHESAKTAGKL